jgi:hypothetical protein
MQKNRAAIRPVFLCPKNTPATFGCAVPIADTLYPVLIGMLPGKITEVQLY